MLFINNNKNSNNRNNYNNNNNKHLEIIYCIVRKRS